MKTQNEDLRYAAGQRVQTLVDEDAQEWEEGTVLEAVAGYADPKIRGLVYQNHYRVRFTEDDEMWLGEDELLEAHDSEQAQRQLRRLRSEMESVDPERR